MGDDRRSGPKRLYVLGTIHSNHTRSKAYSPDVLAEAFRRAEPDLLLAETPPDRIAEAYRRFRYYGKMPEPGKAAFHTYAVLASSRTKKPGTEIRATTAG